ncbi:4-hydroxy-tetrahydrodipicolinate synthase [Halarsenatibacter silvermanii]|uniref:4-hydroxy-tetrahydrodipicolinate synthase n=1 Tax=Halarsenatibacter silvermanii TaxID=321763 RepID=A0A1G9LL30_9FIRM|nr:4-hydroxy-tetrahydrodipicolinate synthase [Halarsenatibacter silvermanii]SDL62719.1 dihydrodipicolinate synthase [Halarsenatibacter silvermanii]
MKFGPLVTAMITPFTEENQVNYDEAARIAVDLAENGCDDILVSGTTGESPALSEEEKIKLIETVAGAVEDKAGVIAGTGSYNTKKSIELSHEAKMAGADKIMLVVPYYNKPPQASLYEHFKTAAESIKLPIMLYNVPSRTSRNLEADTTVKLSEIDNITAIKEASGDVEQGAEIVARTGPDFQVLSGDDGLTLPLMAVGGEGIVSVAANLISGRIKKMINNCFSNDFHEARKIQKDLLPVFQAMFITTNPIPVKTAMSMKGWNTGDLRLPLTAMNEEDKNELERVLTDKEII